MARPTGLRPFTLFLDETGDRGLVNFDRRYPVLCVCGCIIEDRRYRDEVIPALDAFKVEWFGNAGVTLHYSGIMKRSGPFVIFRDRDRLYAFEQALASLIQRLPIVVVAASINKAEYSETASRVPPKDQTWPRDLYSLATDFVIERFVGFVEQQDGIASAIIAEARGRREDRQLQEHYTRRVKAGTQFYSAERLSILPAALDFKTKQDSVAGLELADLLAPPIATRTLREDAEQGLLWQAIRPKIWLRGDNRPGGVGLKTFPNPTGRSIMGTPLKSPEGP